MPRALAVVLETHVLLSDATTGGWCDTCLLPSVVTVPWVAVNPVTLQVMLRGEVTACTDCGDQGAGHACRT